VRLKYIHILLSFLPVFGPENRISFGKALVQQRLGNEYDVITNETIV